MRERDHEEWDDVCFVGDEHVQSFHGFSKPITIPKDCPIPDKDSQTTCTQIRASAAVASTLRFSWWFLKKTLGFLWENYQTWGNLEGTDVFLGALSKIKKKPRQ